ncbi:hypothetical protein MKW92_020485 [Papaver armeniacum]|nr:hypothetical protein MKW92_020485 [Papaver armeniacum]
MSVVPSCQIYQTSFLDSFQTTSLSRFSGYPMQFARYGSSISSKKLYLSITQNSISSNSVPERNPPRNNSQKTASNGGLSNNEWNETHHSNTIKRPQGYKNSGGFSSEDDESNTITSTAGSSTMEKIVEKLKSFGYVDDSSEREGRRVPERSSVEDIFYVEEGTRGGASSHTPLDVENYFGGNGDIRFPWEKPMIKEAEGNSVRSKSRTSLAELTLPESELRRLRNLAVKTKSKTKVGGAGVTQAVVEKIHEKWKSSEIVRLKCEGPPALNMKRLHEILERKTGGLVIWRSGSSISLYRGSPSNIDNNYYAPVAESNTKHQIQRVSNFNTRSGKVCSEVGEISTVNPVPEVKYEHEIDKTLDGLGPRYTDWPGPKPLPVDADLLPGVVPDYKPPYRILPYGVRSNLGLKEGTALRRLARVLPPHFAVGRCRQHHGLAMAMVKLWESSSVAKIALKRGVQLTTSERMAEDIKKLTGGTMLTRNKDFIVFYRGKDFLTPDVTEALLERERLAKDYQDEEEQARLRASSFFIPITDKTSGSGATGTLGETLEADARWGKRLNDTERDKVLQEAEVARHATLVRKLESKLRLAQRKLDKAEKALAKVEECLKPVEQPTDQESISDEERFMFRKLGLRMKAFLLLEYAPTLEIQELVKVMAKAKNFDQVRSLALALEAESGGILVSVDKVSKGYAIIVFRGKDYHRPATLRPKNLLTKRKALARSIELQRREALYNHISAVQRRVDILRSELNQMETVKDHGDEELYAKLD